ncbi:hypothetical protein NDU88_007044 [Pleurodeles waltl]|uniref:Uncharacterized protein n=1 Tax=Pleurodeles waltl TaxID=8319 RepID=A0AAV7WCH2_PLEWA|nr:hypothetical protein NDU88_007044 [Pleurodeles waltl]
MGHLRIPTGDAPQGLGHQLADVGFPPTTGSHTQHAHLECCLLGSAHSPPILHSSTWEQCETQRVHITALMTMKHSAPLHFKEHFYLDDDDGSNYL